METEDFRLDEEEAERIGAIAGTELRVLTVAALRVLAAHYIDKEYDFYWFGHYFGQFGGGGRVVAGAHRVHILAILMGEEAYRALVAEKAAEWRRRYSDMDAYIRALARCVTCGASRTLMDEDNRNPECEECADERWRREHPEEWAAAKRAADERAAAAARGDDDIF